MADARHIALISKWRALKQWIKATEPWQICFVRASPLATSTPGSGV